ncbi:MAG: hypothetical protein ACPLPR_00380 [Bacillota bacterium]
MSAVVLLVVAILAGVAAVQVPPLVKNKMWRELAAFTVYMLLGAALCIPQAMGIRLPNPTKTIEAIFRPLAELMR